MKNTKKMVALLLALVLMLGCVIGGTIAYLIDKTTTITNTFTSSDVKITLSETAPTDKTAIKMVPGLVIEKNPIVTVAEGSEDCYLFVKVEKENQFDKYMTYGIAGGWTELTTGSGIYWRTAKANDSFAILAGIGTYTNGAVQVIPTIGKTEMTAANAAKPSLSFTAYAIQLNNLPEGATAATAWALING